MSRQSHVRQHGSERHTVYPPLAYRCSVGVYQTVRNDYTVTVWWPVKTIHCSLPMCPFIIPIIPNICITYHLILRKNRCTIFLCEGPIAQTLLSIPSQRLSYQRQQGDLASSNAIPSARLQLIKKCRVIIINRHALRKGREGRVLLVVRNHMNTFTPPSRFILAYSFLSFSIKNLVKLLSLGGTLLSMFDEVNLPSCVVFVIRSGFGINKIAITLGRCAAAS